MPYNNPPSVDIKNLIVNAGLGVFASTSTTDFAIFIGQIQDEVNDMIVLYDMGGDINNGLTKCGTSENFRLAIRVRSDNYLRAMTRANAIGNLLNLHGAFDVDIGSNYVTYYNEIHQLDLPRLEGYDEDNRPVILFYIEGRREKVLEMYGDESSSSSS